MKSVASRLLTLWQDVSPKLFLIFNELRGITSQKKVTIMDKLRWLDYALYACYNASE
jgi:hypothetical protein